MSEQSTAWFHEDDYCQIELLPAEAEPFIRKQMGLVETFAAAHEAEGGGWTDLYVRHPPPMRLRTLDIRIEELRACIPRELVSFDRVTTGYGSHVETAKSTRAWGRDRMPLIFADFDAQQAVQNIWLAPFAAGDVPVVAMLLSACSLRWSLIHADWWWCKVVLLRDPAAITDYLQLRSRAGEC